MTDSNPAIPFKAETRQLLNILVHSLYTEREIFLRELVSNASDALTRMSFEMLTNRDVLDPDLPLEIRITADADQRLLTITDTGIGMTAEEMAENLGTIARSGARAFIDAAQQNQAHLADIIGQFGVGFYSAFMAAESIRVTSRSFRKDAEAATWYSTGEDTFTVEKADKKDRGTVVEVKLKEDAVEFAQETRLREIIKRHSDFINYPIFLGTGTEQVNRQTAIWRQNPRQVKDEDYDEFYKQLTLDFEAPLAHAHLVVDAPAQMFAVLFISEAGDRLMFSPRRQAGLKLYARKVLIQEYCTDLLPEYYDFVQGVVDSEDLPLNVSRESIQANRVMAQLKRLVTNKVTDTLKALAKDNPEAYAKFWKSYGRKIKEGIATEQTDTESLSPLLRFHTTTNLEAWSSLDDVAGRMKPGQDKLYYLLADDEHSAQYSPHLDPFRKRGVEVIVMGEPIDSFMLLRLTQYKDFALVNVAAAGIELPKVEGETPAQPEAETPAVEGQELANLIERMKGVLGDKVTAVRATDRLQDSPARLVDPDGSPEQSFQRVYRLINKDYQIPKKVLEINPRHPIVTLLSALPAEDGRLAPVVEQLYEDALLVEGLHPDPAAMIGRIQKIIEASLK